MADKILLPSTNLKGADIRDTLNSGGGIVNNSSNTWFSEAANINMWSKYKPIPFDIDFIDLSQNDNYKGKDKNCGITIPTYENLETFKEHLQSGEALWSYIPPRGKKYGEPRRIGDFRNYYKEAINPVGDMDDVYRATNDDGKGPKIIISPEINVDKDAEYNLTLWDLALGTTEIPVDQLYLGTYLVRTTSSLKRPYYIYTTAEPIGTDNEVSITIPLDYEESGTFNAYLFLSNVIQDGNDDAQDGFFVSLNKPGKKIIIKGAGSLYELILYNAVWNDNGNSFHYEIEAVNNNSTEKTFQTIKLYLQSLLPDNNGNFIDKEENWQNEAISEENKIIADSVTIPKESSVMLTGDFSFVRKDDRMYRVRATCETPQIIGEPIPFEEKEKDPFE